MTCCFQMQMHLNYCSVPMLKIFFKISIYDIIRNLFWNYWGNLNTTSEKFRPFAFAAKFKYKVFWRTKIGKVLEIFPILFNIFNAKSSLWMISDKIRHGLLRGFNWIYVVWALFRDVWPRHQNVKEANPVKARQTFTMNQRGRICS